MIKELTEDFIPNKILHRDEQINRIESVFDNFKQHGIGSNLIIMGVSGSGKTTVIRKITKERDNHVYGSGASTKTSFRTFKDMFKLKSTTNGDLLTKIIEFLKEKPSILIIDEVNKIIDKENFFNDLNTIYRETICPIIIVTNNRTIVEEMPDDARLTLFFDKVEFPSYNATELYDIVKQRIELIKDKIPEVPDGALRKICAIGRKDSSARTVLVLTLKCVLANDFMDSHIDYILKSMMEEDWKNFIFGLKPNERQFLNSLLDLQCSKEYIEPSDLSKTMDNFSPSRISQMITNFQDYGIIESKYKNMGRSGGRLRLIKFVSEEIFDTLNDLMEKL